MIKAPISLLTSHERSLRPALPRLIENINTQLDSLSFGLRPAKEEIFSVVKCFNLCALAHALMGMAENARQLCQAEIAWIEKIAARTGDKGLLSYAFQPWVNLARIDRFSGNVSGALERLDCLRKAWYSEPVCLDSLSVQKNDWPQMVDCTPELPAYLRYNWTHENLLCALRENTGERLKDIEARLNGNASGLDLHSMFIEARLIAHRLSDCKAVSGIEPVYWDEIRTHKDSYLYSIRLAELLSKDSEAGFEHVNTTALYQIATHLLADSPTTWQLSVVQSIIALLWECDQDAAAALATAAYREARLLGDEVFEYWFAEVCANTDNPDPVWQQRCRELKTRSWHIGIRSPDSPDQATRCETIEQTANRIIEFSSKALRSNNRSVVCSLSSLKKSLFTLPALTGKIQPTMTDSNKATVACKFRSRQLLPLGPVVDPDTPAHIRSGIEVSDFSEQVSFASKPYKEALESASPVTRHILTRMADAFRVIHRSGFDEERIKVCVRVDKQSNYVQMQGPHIDWTKGTEFHEDEWDAVNPAQYATQTFKTLGNIYSIDCVLGGPPTEYFLEEQPAVINMKKGKRRAWLIEDIEFPDTGTAKPGKTGEMILRPPYTIHQFPSPAKWTSPSRLRLFISCDYHCDQV